MRYRCTCVVLCTLMLGACASAPTYIALPDAAKSQLTSTDVVAAIPQSEIAVYVPATNPSMAGGGLIGALITTSIDDVRVTKAEEALEPLRNALIGYDFDQMAAAELKTALSTQTILNVTGVTAVKNVSAKLTNAVTGSKSAAVLVTAFDYHLEYDGIGLTVNLTANLFPNTDTLKTLRPLKGNKQILAPQNALYHRTFMHIEMIPNTPAKIDRNTMIARWSADNGAAMRNALTKAVTDLAHQLAADFAPAAAK